MGKVSQLLGKVDAQSFDIISSLPWRVWLVCCLRVLSSDFEDWVKPESPDGRSALRAFNVPLWIPCRECWVRLFRGGQFIP